MASAWIEKRKTKSGVRFRVRYRIGGREGTALHAGVFNKLKDARDRQAWVVGELAAMRVPDFRLVKAAAAVTLRDVAERWRASRIDVGEMTATNHRVDLARVMSRLGTRAPSEIAAADVAQLVAELHEKGTARETIRKTVTTFAQVLDFAGVTPNPARDRAVKLPRQDHVEVNPPTATHVLAIHRLLPAAYRLPFLTLDATGMRVGELEALTWGDVDEPGGRWRVSAASAKTRQARWVPVPLELFAVVAQLVPREDRDLAGQVFAGFGADRLRTAIARACKATGTPLYSPHDLRHRRATLWHLGGVPAAEAASWLGHSAQEHLRTYAHATLVDRAEVDHAELARAGSDGAPSVLPAAVE